MTMLPDRATERPIAPLGSRRKHYWMVMRMADAAGINLVDAMRQGRLTQPDWAGMVARCRGCDSVQACDRWLADASAQGTPRPVPRDCLNHAQFAALKSRKTQS